MYVVVERVRYRVLVLVSTYLPGVEMYLLDASQRTAALIQWRAVSISTLDSIANRLATVPSSRRRKFKRGDHCVFRSATPYKVLIHTQKCSPESS